jgi:hypothetical protein
MNRSVAGVGIVLILFGFGLLSYPIIFTGVERFDLEQELGIYIVPIGLLVVLLGAMGHNPEATTVGGAFGNPDADVMRSAARPAPAVARPTLRYSPKEPVACRFCRTNIPWDVAICPRCARPRECRSCGRPLGVVLDRPTCPTCARAEVFCNCPALARPVRPPTASTRRVVRS